MEVEIYAMKLAQNPIEKWGNIAVIVWDLRQWPVISYIITTVVTAIILGEFKIIPRFGSWICCRHEVL
jgi:hypothetical protein